jgi:uncharacterized protein (DUF305 family)
MSSDVFRRGKTMNRQPLNYVVVGRLMRGVIIGSLMVSCREVQPSQSSLKPSPSEVPANGKISPAPSPKNDLHHPATPASSPANRMMAMADQHFIEMMIPHHQDAVEMANLALTLAKQPELKKLAESIKQDQTSEIQQMRSWYKAWYGKDVPAVSMMNRHGMMGSGPNKPQGQTSGRNMGMQRSIVSTDLTALKNATDFDKEFIRQMIPHHQMAVHMAQMVLNHNTHPEIGTLAQSIIKSQTAEIKQMQEWQKT